jgi:hypothetical protein
MGRRLPDEHTTDPRNTRMEETSRRRRIMETSSEEGQAQKRL